MDAFKRINIKQAKQLCEQGAVMVDIRDPESYANGHPTGAIHLDNHSLADFIANADLMCQPLLFAITDTPVKALRLFTAKILAIHTAWMVVLAWAHSYPSLVERTQ